MTRSISWHQDPESLRFVCTVQYKADYNHRHYTARFYDTSFTLEQLKEYLFEVELNAIKHIKEIFTYDRHTFLP